jgi:hypothetical protein
MLHQSILTAVLLFGASVVGVPNPAPIPEAASFLVARTGEYVGGIDMNSACADQYGSMSTSDQKGNSCDAWKCVVFGNHPAINLNIDVNRACTKQHGVSAYGYCSTDAFGWGCYKN